MKTHEGYTADIVPMICDILGVEPEEVQPESRFFEDLNGESIDVLDLSFRLEQFYKTKIPLQQIIPSSELATDTSGRLTPESQARLEGEYPFLDLARLGDTPQLSRLTELFTVDAIAHLVEATLIQNVAESAMP